MRTQTAGKVLLVFALFVFAAGPFAPQASAQDYTDEELEAMFGNVALAAEEMYYAGVDANDPAWIPVAFAISQVFQVDGTSELTVEEVQAIVRRRFPNSQYGSQGVSLRSRGLLIAAPTLMLIQNRPRAEYCETYAQKAEDARRLARSLSRISQLNAAGAGIVSGIMGVRGGWFAARFALPLGFAAAATGMMASWAGELAGAYANAPCMAGGKPWKPAPPLAIKA